MKKSVYSLVLMDDVIRAVDEQAYRLGTSRSNLINQILAEQLCCVTPEMRMREIFDSVTELISSNFQVQQQRSASLLTLRTALEYRYRPTISYKIEIKREPDEFIGNLRVQIRTQNQQLIALFNNFFISRIIKEKKCLSDVGYDNYEYEISSGSFTRKLINSKMNSEKTGMAISEYIKQLNDSLQFYLSSPMFFRSDFMENEYREFLKKFII
ncbi:MAG: hypothetical protein K2O29_02815 [Ruminococcus sp.]|nr:hypothetical protein [Ruminococcus sp.]MDE6848802.1 hypothetical protein [Ruminococcus sp.]MDE7137378.1 hypothetical protein [Ruminococcus sp.]